MNAEELRTRIRNYEIPCRCSLQERGFRVVDGALAYGGATGHRADCQWAKAVAKVYEMERK
jgi:hypothetical protein